MRALCLSLSLRRVYAGTVSIGISHLCLCLCLCTVSRSVRVCFSAPPFHRFTAPPPPGAQGSCSLRPAVHHCRVLGGLPGVVQPTRCRLHYTMVFRDDACLTHHTVKHVMRSEVGPCLAPGFSRNITLLLGNPSAFLVVEARLQ